MCIRDRVIRLQARQDNEYIRFLFTDTRREKSVEELNQLFYPNQARMTSEICIRDRVYRIHSFAGIRLLGRW